jgi:hypothetical protein
MLLFEEWSKDPVIRQQQIALVFDRRKPQKKPIKRRTRPSKAWDVGEHQRFWHLEPWQQSFAQSLPRRPRCADDFDLGVYPCRREIALGFRYIQYNIPERISWLVSDIDRAGASKTRQTVMRTSRFASLIPSLPSAQYQSRSISLPRSSADTRAASERTWRFL